MAYRSGHIILRIAIYIGLSVLLFEKFWVEIYLKKKSFLANKTVSGHFKSDHSDLKKKCNNIVANCNKNVAKYYQNNRKKKKVIQKTKIWDLMVWCFDGKLYRAKMSLLTKNVNFFKLF